jgi:hypothetical protein
VPEGTGRYTLGDVQARSEPMAEAYIMAAYAPPEHPPGTVQQTKEEAEAAERH